MKFKKTCILINTILLTIMTCTASYASEKLQVWIRASNDSKNIYQNAAAKFKEKTGIEIQYFNTVTDFEQRLARAAMGRSLPDLIFNDATAMGQFVDLGIVDEINPDTISGGKNIYDVAWQSTKYTNGKYYGVPISAQSFALIIRKDWRENLKADLPKNWDDVYQLAYRFTFEDPDGNGKNDTYGFIVPASPTRGYTSWFLSTFIWQAGGDYLKQSSNGKFISSLNTDEVKKSLQYIQKMICNKVSQPGAINATTADGIPSFRSGQTGMFLTGPYHLALFDREPGKDKYEVIPFPNGDMAFPTLSEGTTAFLMNTSKHKEAAKQFIEFMISQEGQEIGMGKGSNYIPVVRLSINKNVDIKKVYNDPRWEVFANIYTENGRYVPQVPNWTPIRQITADGFNKILSTCDPSMDKQLAELDKKVNIELDNQKVLEK